jgi:hypothetical protein
VNFFGAIENGFTVAVPNLLIMAAGTADEVATTAD